MISFVAPATVMSPSSSSSRGMLSAGDFESLVRLVEERDIYLFSDEMYRFLETDANDRLPAACEVCEKAITLFGVSKTFGLPGLRIGWIATRAPELIEQICVLKDYTTICASGPSEILAVIALRAKGRIISLQR